MRKRTKVFVELRVRLGMKYKNVVASKMRRDHG